MTGLFIWAGSATCAAVVAVVIAIVRQDTIGDLRDDLRAARDERVRLGEKVYKAEKARDLYKKEAISWSGHYLDSLSEKQP